MRANHQSESVSDYMTPDEAARATGLSVRQLSRLADAGRLRTIRPGTHRRYLTQDVAAIIAQDADWSPA